jgi:hypothetical protein
MAARQGPGLHHRRAHTGSSSELAALTLGDGSPGRVPPRHVADGQRFTSEGDLDTSGRGTVTETVDGEGAERGGEDATELIDTLDDEEEAASARREPSGLPKSVSAVYEPSGSRRNAARGSAPADGRAEDRRYSHTAVVEPAPKRVSPGAAERTSPLLPHAAQHPRCSQRTGRPRARRCAHVGDGAAPARRGLHGR